MAHEPSIRAIRLNQSKSTKDIEHMTEKNVLKYYFEKISNKLNIEYFDRWDNIENTLLILDEGIRDISNYTNQL